MVKHRHRQRELFVSIIRTLLRTISTVIRIIGTIDGILGTLHRETDRSIDRSTDGWEGRKPVTFRVRGTMSSKGFQSTSVALIFGG